MRKVIAIGKSRIKKELDVIKLIKTIRNLKFFVKNTDEMGQKWKDTKQKVPYQNKYIISLDNPIDKIQKHSIVPNSSTLKQNKVNLSNNEELNF